MDAGLGGGFFWVLAMVAAALVGLSKGGLPVVGMLGVPVLSLAISPILAAGLLLPVFVVSDMFGLYAYRREFDGRVVKLVVIGATVGVTVGWATASVVSERAVRLIVGGIGLVFAVYLSLRPAGARVRKRAGTGKGLFWSAVAGFTSFVSHAGAPPFQVFVLPLGLPKAVFAGTATICFAYINAIKLIPYYALGQLSLENLRVSALLVPVAVLAVFVGVRLVRILPERQFFRIVTAALFAVSVKLIADGVAG